jgi:hypothetical protein
MRDPNIKPRWVLVKLDETKYWNIPDKFKPYIKRIFGLYMTDTTVGVYCCELTASCELHPLNGQVEFVDGYAEQLCDEIDVFVMEGFAETDVKYVHMCDVATWAVLDTKKQWWPDDDSNAAIIELGDMADEYGFAKEDELDAEASEDFVREAIRESVQTGAIGC